MSSLHGTDKTPQGQEISHSVQMTLERLTPLLGVWQGSGHGEYPTIADFHYTETIRFRRECGADYLTYEQSTELVDAQGNPIRRSHWEAGVLKPLDDGEIELACVQSGGRVEVLRGNMLAEETHPAKFSLRFHSALVGNDARVRSTSRKWHLDGDQFRYEMRMAAQRVDELILHVEASLHKL
jgi:hypothetical protein